MIWKAKTDYGSPKLSCLTVNNYLKRAKEIGENVIAVTDLTMYGVMPLYEAAKKQDVRLVTGAEVTLCDEPSAHPVVFQFALYAKDITGYHAISRLLTASQKNTVILDGYTYPTITTDLLNQYVGPDSSGHGHVLVSSGGINGCLLGVIREKEAVRAQIAEIDRLIQSGKTIYNSLIETTEKVALLEFQITSLTAISKQSFATEKRALKAMADELRAQFNPDPEKAAEVYQRREQLQEKEQRVETAKKELVKARRQRGAMKRVLEDTQLLADSCTHIDGCEHEALEEYLHRLEIAKNGLLTKMDSTADFRSILRDRAKYYVQLAGEGNFLIELQNHGIKEEAELMPLIAEIAVEQNIPVIATNEAFMANRENLSTRRTIYELVDNTSHEILPGECEMYVKSKEDIRNALLQILPKEIVEKALDDTVFENACQVEFQKTPHYPEYPCSEYTDETEKEFLAILEM